MWSTEMDVDIAHRCPAGFVVCRQAEAFCFVSRGLRSGVSWLLMWSCCKQWRLTEARRPPMMSEWALHTLLHCKDKPCPEQTLLRTMHVSFPVLPSWHHFSIASCMHAFTLCPGRPCADAWSLEYSHIQQIPCLEFDLLQTLVVVVSDPRRVHLPDLQPQQRPNISRQLRCCTLPTTSCS